jgi:hypothetical protein
VSGSEHVQTELRPRRPRRRHVNTARNERPARYAGAVLARAILAFVVTASFAEPAGAQTPLERAREAYESGALGEAVQRFERALRTPGNSTETLIEIHLHLGVLRAALGNAQAARAEFDIALALSPELAVPSELPPEQAAIFEQIRSARPGGLRAIAEVEREGERISVRARVENAPAGLVAELHLSTQDGWSREVEGERAELALERSAREIEVVALDAFGGVLARVSASVPALAVPAVVEVVPPRPVRASILDRPTRETEDEDLAANPWLWTGIAIGVAVIAAVAIALGVTMQDHPGFGAPSIVD